MIQVYTGNGKGKTTAALGLALRAAGAGYKVYIARFVKGRVGSEEKILRKIKNIKSEQFGRRCFIKGKPGLEDMRLAKKGLKKIAGVIKNKGYGLIILDEVNIALDLGLLELRELKVLLDNFPKDREIVLTGRYAHPAIIKMADLVSEVREIKHYLGKGVKGRRGIEF